MKPAWIAENAVMRWRQYKGKFMLRRLTAGALLFLLVGDLVLHLGETFLEEPLAQSRETSLVAAALDIGHSDESNCPVPGHSGGRSHHHHFPGVITSHSVVPPSTLRHLITVRPSEQSFSASLIANPGRAPPRI